MITKLEAEQEDVKKRVVETTGKLMSGKFVLEDTPSAEALERLENLKTNQIDKYKKRD
jgi:hypothetical protein